MNHRASPAGRDPRGTESTKSDLEGYAPGAVRSNGPARPDLDLSRQPSQRAQSRRGFARTEFTLNAVASL